MEVIKWYQETQKLNNDQSLKIQSLQNQLKANQNEMQQRLQEKELQITSL